MASSGKGSRSKGKAAELEVVRLAREAGFPDAARDWAEAHNGGQLHGDIKGIPGVHLEVRRREALSIESWCREVEEKVAEWRCLDCGQPRENPGVPAICAAAHRPQTPIVAFRRNNQPWRAALPLVDLLNLLSTERN